MTPTILIVMGVSGSGKSTVAQILAKDLGWAFQEGDALHPPANVEKMRLGIALTDSDRAALADDDRKMDQRQDRGGGIRDRHLLRAEAGVSETVDRGPSGGAGGLPAWRPGDFAGACR